MRTLVWGKSGALLTLAAECVMEELLRGPAAYWTLFQKLPRHHKYGSFRRELPLSKLSHPAQQPPP
jgi:hypothetical protein